MARFWKKFMAEFMARGWQSYGKVVATSVPRLTKVLAMLWQEYGHVMARIWQKKNGGV